jgi:hypothetical protein
MGASNIGAPINLMIGPMSALGQKQTFAVQNGMSALHPKADMCGAKSDVRFVPIADIKIPSQYLRHARYLVRQKVYFHWALATLTTSSLNHLC